MGASLLEREKDANLVVFVLLVCILLASILSPKIAAVSSDATAATDGSFNSLTYLAAWAV